MLPSIMALGLAWWKKVGSLIVVSLSSPFKHSILPGNGHPEWSHQWPSWGSQAGAAKQFKSIQRRRQKRQKTTEITREQKSEMSRCREGPERTCGLGLKKSSRALSHVQGSAPRLRAVTTAMPETRVLIPEAGPEHLEDTA